MKPASIKQLMYIVASSIISTVLVVMSLLTMKDAACQPLLESIENALAYSGPCASDGSGFALMAIGIFLVVMALNALNVWVIKQIKL